MALVFMSHFRVLTIRPGDGKDLGSGSCGGGGNKEVESISKPGNVVDPLDRQVPLLSCFTVLPVTRVVQLARRCEKHGTPQHRCVVLQRLQPPTHTLPPSPVKAAADFNILGIISFSVFFAVVLSSLGPQAEPIINTINILNVVIERMVKAILFISRAGIASIIASRVIFT